MHEPSQCLIVHFVDSEGSHFNRCLRRFPAFCCWASIARTAALGTELPTREFAAPHREQNVALPVVHKGRKRVDRAP
jgi:5-formyltetrahydrofolate cyclo-ligase